MKPRRTVIILLLILLAVCTYLLTGDRPLALLARWRKANDDGERFTMDEVEAALFEVEADESR